MKIDRQILAEKNHGLVIGNAVMSGGVTAKGDMFRRIVYNPSCFDMGKNEPIEAGFCTFSFFDAKNEDLKWNIIEHTYPRFRSETVLENDLLIRTEAICPLDANDCETMFLPAILVNIKAINRNAIAQKGTVAFAWEQGALFSEAEACVPSDSSFIEKGNSYLACFGCDDVSYEAQGNALGCHMELCLAASEEKNITIPNELRGRLKGCLHTEDAVVDGDCITLKMQACEAQAFIIQ